MRVYGKYFIGLANIVRLVVAVPPLM